MTVSARPGAWRWVAIALAGSVTSLTACASEDSTGISSGPTTASPAPSRLPRLELGGFGCLENQGDEEGDAQTWYSGDEFLSFGLGDEAPTSAATTAIAEHVTAALGSYEVAKALDVTAPGDSSCTISRWVHTQGADGSTVSVGVWGLDTPADLWSIPRHNAFVTRGTDMLVSTSTAKGNITLLKVLPNGTTIRITANSPSALSLWGWPTTVAPPTTGPGTPPPAPPAQSVAELVALADDLAGVVATW